MYSLVYENEFFMIINKNQDVDFHKTTESVSLIKCVREKEGLTELLPVHRLDRMTSGLMIFAKSRDVSRSLSQQFQARAIEKYYIAISDKKPKKSQGLISGDMEKARRGAWKLLPSRINPAQTRFFSKSYGKGFRLFILKPLTGKTHQLRVALKSIGSPILGDPIYNRATSTDFDRGYLHSYALKFTHHGTPYCFTNKPEEGILFHDNLFVKALEQFKEPWLLNWPGSQSVDLS